MTDRIKVMMQPHRLKPEFLTTPDTAFTGDLLGGGQIIAGKKNKLEMHGRNQILIAGPAEALRINTTSDEDGALMMTAYEVNLSKLLYGHNGRSLSEHEFLTALSLLLAYFDELLDSPSESLDMIPGLTSQGTAYYQLLEIAFHLADPTGEYFEAFRNASHPCARKRLVESNESIRFGDKKAKVAISVYRKVLQMQELYRSLSETPQHELLRIELILKADKLADAFTKSDASTTPCIDLGNSERLTGFRFERLATVHQLEMMRFEGVSSSSAKSDNQDKTGCFIAQAHHVMEGPGRMNLSDMIDLFGRVTGAAKEKVRRIRRAALWQREQLLSGRFDLAQLFSAQTYDNMPSVHIPEKESFLGTTRLATSIHPRVREVYGSMTPSTKFTPLTSL